MMIVQYFNKIYLLVMLTSEFYFSLIVYQSFFIPVWVTVAPTMAKLYLSVCVCLSVYSFYDLYLGYYGSDLKKLGGSGGSYVQLLVSKFHKNRFNDDVIITSSFLF